LLTSRTDRNQVEQMAGILAHNIALTELALEHYPPEAVSQLNGFQLLVANRPGAPQAASNGEADPSAADDNPVEPSDDHRLSGQLNRLSEELCNRLHHCPPLVPSPGQRRGVWIRIRSSLEPVWLFSPLPAQGLFSPDPLVISLSMLGGSVLAGGLFLLLEVQRPLRKLSGAISRVGTTTAETTVPVTGSSEVRQLATRFNAMLARLETNERERQTMLAGITHDLNSPITRLGVRLSLATDSLQTSADGSGGEARLQRRDLERMSADLGAIQQITRQFLQFASCGEVEPFTALRLDALLLENCGAYDDQGLTLDLQPLEATVQPTGIVRSVLNLLDNAYGYGATPVRLALRRRDELHFQIRVQDAGAGLTEQTFQQAKEPFQRIDPSRGGKGHCGLGLAIAERVAQAHGGSLTMEAALHPGPGGFTICFNGRLNPEAARAGVRGMTHGSRSEGA
jgi:two-component system osmolarity sensor histidine kinase EnvZ